MKLHSLLDHDDTFEALIDSVNATPVSFMVVPEDIESSFDPMADCEFESLEDAHDLF